MRASLVIKLMTLGPSKMKYLNQSIKLYKFPSFTGAYEEKPLATEEWDNAIGRRLQLSCGGLDGSNIKKIAVCLEEIEEQKVWERWPPNNPCGDKDAYAKLVTGRSWAFLRGLIDEVVASGLVTLERPKRGCWEELTREDWEKEERGKIRLSRQNYKIPEYLSSHCTEVEIESAKKELRDLWKALGRDMATQKKIDTSNSHCQYVRIRQARAAINSAIEDLELDQKRHSHRRFNGCNLPLFILPLVRDHLPVVSRLLNRRNKALEAAEASFEAENIRLNADLVLKEAEWIEARRMWELMNPFWKKTIAAETKREREGFYAYAPMAEAAE